MNVNRTPVADAYGVHKAYWADSGADIEVPIDPFAIADRMGIRVYSAILGPNRSGYLSLDPAGRPVIYVNEAHAPVRQRFTVAHEIGYYVDARERGLFDKVVSFDRDHVSSRGTEPTEIYANRFAAALLMPRAVVEDMIDRGLTTRELAGRFGVSQESMAWRLQNLGLQAR